MNLKKSVILTLAGMACAGLLYVSSGVASSTGESKSATAQEISGEWGTTTIIEMEPIDSMFSHKNHVVRYGFTCDACHTELFDKKVGSSRAKGDYTMAAMAEGKYCGGCHNDEIAFDANAKANCTQCHAEPPEMVVFDKPVKAVIFDHAGHVDIGLDCSDCHSDVFEMEVGAAEHHPEHFTMEALYEGKYCGACHDGDLAFASNTRCTACHIGVKGFDRMFGQAQKDSHGGGH
jgi:c(7)-type cytochrome triheme protein